MNLDQVFFLSIAAIGAAFLLVSFILGEIGDVFDSVGSFIGGQLGFGEGDSGAFSIDHEGPSPLSLRNLMAFFTAYGASGLITSAYGWPTLSSSLFAVVPGVVIGGVAYKLMQVLYRQESSSLLEVSTLVGRVGIIDLSIPAAGLGKVTVSTDTGTTTFLARAEGGGPIQVGEKVIVKGSLGSDLIVGPVSDNA